MNKEKIVNELNKFINDLDKDFQVTEEDGRLYLKWRNLPICHFLDFNKEKFYFDNFIINLEYSKACGFAIESGLINEFYTSALELMEEYADEYTIQVFPNDLGYLHVNSNPEGTATNYRVGRSEDSYYLTKTKFTKEEIEELKRREDLAIDWNKAKIEKVSDDDES